MRKKIPVMKTKLLAPRIKEEYLYRACLTRKMKTISKYPLTILHAGAGYGKSTALAQFIKDEHHSCCWYSISSSDDDLLTFLRYIISSIQTEVPGFAIELNQYIDQIGPYLYEEDLITLCSLFINELVSIEKDMILILDDYHQIEHSSHIHMWMEKFIEHIPDHIHLVISSRSLPKWSLFTKMKARKEILEITQNDLTLTKEEMKLLICDIYDLNVTESQLEDIFVMTEGWMIAVGMIVQNLPEPTFEIKVQMPSNRLEHLFQYLAQEVFEKQLPMIQKFLEQTSVFEEMDINRCQTVLGITNAKEMLDYLIERNLFIQKIGNNQFRYHALFKDFLEKQLKKNQPHHFFTLNKNCAHYFEQNMQIESAFFHYQKINHTEKIASLLNEYGATMLHRGKLNRLYELLQKVPSELKDQFFRLWFLEGEILRYRSYFKEAEFCYNRSLQEAEKTENTLEKSKALSGIAKIYLDTIQPDTAELYLNEAIILLQKNGLHDEVENGKLYRLLAENYVNFGEAGKAEKWLERARQLMENQADVHLEARMLLRTGKIDHAKKLLKEKEGKAKDSLPQSHRESDLLLALLEVFEGRGLEAKVLSQKAIRYGSKMQSPFLVACGWMRMGHAVQILRPGDDSFAMKCYETSLEIMGGIQIERGKAEPNMGLCLLYGRRGDYEKAIAAGQAALKETEKVKDNWLSSYIALSMGIASIENNQMDLAFPYLLKAEKMFTHCRDDYGKTLAYLWLSYFSFIQQSEDFTKKYLPMLYKQLELGSFLFIFKNRTLFGPKDLQQFAPMLIKAGRTFPTNHIVMTLLRELNLSPLHSHPGYTLRIETLDSFKVWLGEKEIEERKWRRGKAKELLQLFCTRPSYRFPKEEIFLKLWPDQDIDSAARDFKVALNALNKVLEPDRKAREAPLFLTREGTAYGLNIQAGIEIDYLLFEQWVSFGLEEDQVDQSLPFLEEALHLYKGDFLRERRFEEWYLNDRERLQVLFLRASEKLAQLRIRNEEYNQAINWCERILEKDRTWEEAYRLLMFCYYCKNNRPFALKWYHKCCEVLEEELGVPPLEPTRRMYEWILNPEKDIAPL